MKEGLNKWEGRLVGWPVGTIGVLLPGPEYLATILAVEKGKQKKRKKKRCKKTIRKKENKKRKSGEIIKEALFIFVCAVGSIQTSTRIV